MAPTIDRLLRDESALAKGPVALILCEDEVEIEGSLRHALGCGFRWVAAGLHPRMTLPPGLGPRVVRFDWDFARPGATAEAVNAVIAARPGMWVHYAYNAEYLFYPFHGHRTVGELTAFAAEERRASVMTFTVDLYARDLAAHPSAVDRGSAHLDRTGYYALGRQLQDGSWPDRQMEFFGGLRWRFEEHVPKSRRRIDRVALLRTAPGLRLTDDHLTNRPEANTFACPWHHSPTAALASFRTAKALKANPGSRDAIRTFTWHNSVPFTWEAQQLLDLGLMEPGQWF